MQTIADIVKRINALTLEEMEEIINIISKILVEKKRQLYFEQYQQALTDSKRVNFSPLQILKKYQVGYIQNNGNGVEIY